MWSNSPIPRPPPKDEIPPPHVGWSAAGKLAILATIAFSITPGTALYKTGSAVAVILLSIFWSAVLVSVWKWTSQKGRAANWDKTVRWFTTAALVFGIGWMLLSLVVAIAVNGLDRSASRKAALDGSAISSSELPLAFSCSGHVRIDRVCTPSETASMDFLGACMAEMKAAYADIWEVQAKDLSRQYCYCREKYAKPFFEDSDVRKAYLLGDRRVLAGISRSEATCKQEAVKDGRKFAPDDPQPGWP